MSSLVLDLDVTKPAGELRVEPPHDRAHLLLRWEGIPVGIDWLEAREGRISAAQLRDALLPAAPRIARLRALRALGVPSCAAWTEAPPLTVTVAICTRDRPDDLARCLHAVCALPDDGQSVLVVDSASPGEATRAVVARFPHVRYVREERAGLDRARNRALREATTDLVAFIDDDAVPDGRWLRAITREFGDPCTLCVTGLTAPLELETPAQEWFERTNSFGRGFDRVVHDGATESAFVAARAGAGVNMALRRTVLQLVGPFDEALDAGTATRSGGDHDMFTRILTAGYRITYQPAALVRHRHRREWRDLRATVQGYGTGVYAYLLGHLLRGELGALRVVLAWHWSQLRRVGRALVAPAEWPGASLALAEIVGCAAGPFAYRRARKAAARPVAEPALPLQAPPPSRVAAPGLSTESPLAAGTPSPPLSVIVPTHDRRDAVQRLLAALARSTYPLHRLEVIVVADGCTDDTVDALGRCTFPFPLRVERVWPAAGAAAARNRGAGVAHGEVLLFLDDDIEPLAGALAEHDARHAAAQASGERRVVIGAPIPVRTADDSYHHVAMWSWWETQFERMQAPGHRFTHDELFSGVLSLPATLFAAMGGFDERLACREDSELGVRLLAMGASFEFSRRGGGMHHDLRDASRLAARKREEGRADVQLAELHPVLWPSLRLATPPQPWWTPVGALRRLASHSAEPGETLAHMLTMLLPVMERMRQRAAWRAAHGALAYFWYWRGVAKTGAPALACAEACAREVARTSRPRELVADLDEGLAAIEHRLDEQRPDALRLAARGRPWVRIPAVPGAERLRGAHLRRALACQGGAAVDAARITPVGGVDESDQLPPFALPNLAQ